MSPSWARSIQSMFPHPTSGRSILILFSHLCSSLASGLFPPGFPPKPCMHLCCPNTYCMPSSLHSSWFYCLIYVLWGVQIIKLLVMYFSLLPCYLIPLRTKYLPQHPIHRHPQYDRPKFHTHTNKQAKLQFCISWYFCIAKWKTNDPAPNSSKYSLTSTCSLFLY